MILFFACGVLLYHSGQVAGQSFLTLDRASSSSQPLPYPGCRQADIDSCTKADLSLYILMTSTSIQLPDGSQLELAHREDNHVCYQSDRAEAVFTWQGSHVAGNVHVGAESWSLEGCGEKCYLWIKQSSNWEDEVSSSYTERRLAQPHPPANYSRLRDQGERDTTTVVDISVMIWYTSQFRNTFQTEEDMTVYVDLIFAETNQGYINSKIPVQLVRYQIKQHPTMNDMDNAYQMLEDFEQSMPLADLHNCADAAVLLVEQFESSKTCGIGNVGSTLDCRTLSITKKSCSTGYYSFGHELGQNFGCMHNPEAGGEDVTSHFGYSDDGHGHLIEPDDSGYRTILAFGATGHYKRVNYYSNPNVLLPATKTPTGVRDVSNNARLITANRFALAECGNEKLNGNCNGGTTTASAHESSTKSSAYKIDLRGGSNRKEGNVFINGKPVCDDMWDKNDATVACRMLGYSSGIPTRKSKFGSTPSKYILDDVMCDGTETSLFDCGYKERDNCGRNEGAGVVCSGSGSKSNIKLRGGSSRREGNVFLNGKPICDDMWDRNDARVACRMLGYKSGIPTTKSKFGKVPDDYILDDVMCDGTERSLFDCNHQERDNCGKNEGAGVICSRSSRKQSTTTERTPDKFSDIELRGGSNRREGNVFLKGKPVCDDKWDRNDATVACRMLGFSSGIPTTKSKYGSVPSKHILDDVMCDGSETSLFDCKHQKRDNCGRKEGAGVICSGSGKDAKTKVELRGGSRRNEGNVFVNGKPVCDDMWDKNDATVACRMLGYKSGRPTTKSKFGSTPSKYILDDVMCDGTETSLFDCGYRKRDNCGKNEGAGVVCSRSKQEQDSKMKVELRGGTSRKEGNVFVNGKPVCDDMWDKDDATVVCRMLGYPSGVPTIKSRFGSVTSDYSMDDVMCDGTEQSLQDCKYSSQDNCGGSEGAGVICQESKKDDNYDEHDDKEHDHDHDISKIELKGGRVPGEGNVFVNGKPVCDDKWDKNDATVACRMLGYQHGLPTRKSRYGTVPSEFALDDVMCDGSEESLFDCDHSPHANCGKSEGAGVMCQGKQSHDDHDDHKDHDDHDYDDHNDHKDHEDHDHEDYDHEDHDSEEHDHEDQDHEDHDYEDHDHDHEKDEHDDNDHKDVTIELKGGSSSEEGNVFVNGKPVCDDMWDHEDAIVACRMLGFSSGTPTIRSRFGSVPSDYSLDDVMCDGTEQSLLDCGYSPQENCGRGEGAGVICEEKKNDNYHDHDKEHQHKHDVSQIELKGGIVHNEGNIFLDGKPVCDDKWDRKDATVACRMLGFASGVPTSRSRFGAVPAEYALDDVQCEGSEESLFDCLHSPDDNCGENEGAGVICQDGQHTPPPSPIIVTTEGSLSSQVVLKGGNSRGEGNVFLKGRPVCDDSWTANDADVVCHMLGYPNGGKPTKNSAYGRVEPDFLMTDVKCQGTEATLLDCRYTSEHDCTGQEAAGVKCRDY